MLNSEPSAYLRRWAFANLRDAVKRATGEDMSLEVDSLSAWEKNLVDMEANVLQAEAESSPNAKIMRVEYLARKASYLQTRIQTLQNSVQRNVFALGDILNDSTPNVPESVRRISYTPSPRVIDIFSNETVTPVSIKRDIEVIDVPKQSEFVAPRVGEMDEQKFIMRVGMMSNCNVNVQSKKLGSFPLYGGSMNTGRVAYRLYCDHCKQSQNVDDARVIESHIVDDPGLIEFCKSHKHIADIATSSMTDGRKFRDAT